MLPDHQTSTRCPSQYKELYFGSEPQEVVVGKRANYFPVALKFLIGGFLNVGPYCITIKSQNGRHAHPPREWQVMVKTFRKFARDRVFRSSLRDFL